MKFYFALFISKLVYITLKLLGRPATSFAGYVALRICPDFLSNARKYIKGDFINVTGTNGKTTTSGLIAHILSSKGQYINNLEGANMLTGIINTFALQLWPFKSYLGAVIETDEAYLTKIYDYIKTDILVVTNLFNDQLDRYGDVNFTQKIIKEAVDKNSDLKLILNADDPSVANLGKSSDNTVYYGFDNIEYFTKFVDNQTIDNAVNCECSSKFEYSKRFYAHLGHYYCMQCGYKRPEVKYCASVKIYDNNFILQVLYDGKVDEYNVKMKGLYNAYNVLASVSTALESGLSSEEIQKSLNSFKTIFGRSEEKIINGKKTIMQLIKNPVGVNEVLKTIDLDSHILIALNNTVSDGRDTSWLWEADFEKLKSVTKPIIVSGLCAYDTAIRLKYAGVPLDKIILEPNVKKALKMATYKANKEESITILPSYTAMWSIDKR